MTKISNSRKEQLICDVIERTMKERSDKLEKRKEAFAQAVLLSSLGKHAEAFFSLPDTFFPQISRLRVKGESTIHMHLNTPIKATASFFNCIEVSPSEYEELTSIAEEEKVLLKNKSALRSELVKIVYSCNTVEKLHKLWPGSKEYIDIGTDIEHPLAPNCNELLSMLKALEE